jgi:TatD DNase family protein
LLHCYKATGVSSLTNPFRPDSLTDNSPNNLLPLEILRDYGPQVSGVFHCFGGTLEQANDVIALGHVVSFTGIVTFKNGKQVREVAAKVPLDSFMVETDCPYLAPVPYRGKRCEPAYTRLVAEEIARARGVKLEEIAEATTQTAEQFFRFPA